MSPTNFFFQNYTNSNEQEVLEDLVVESIKVYGEDCYYLPRVLTNYDPLLGEDAQSNYDTAYLIEVYLKNVLGFVGNRNFMSKFAGLEIEDQVIFTMARRSFANEIGINTVLTRPREGDILYFPLNQKCFQIQYVEGYENFYQLGSLYTWELTCVLFEYSGQQFSTGVPEIDILQTKFSLNVLDWALRDEAGNWLTDENGTILTSEAFVTSKIDPMADNETLDVDTLGDDLIDWQEKDPFSEGIL